jgi:S1-C subfamily serine protease
MLAMVIGLLGGCCPVAQTLIKPETDEAIMCTGTGFITPPPSWGPCIRDAERRGYVQIQKLGATGVIFDPKDPLKEAIVLAVKPNSPANIANIKVGDKLVERNRILIKCVGDLMSQGWLSPDEIVNYKFSRDGKEFSVTLKAIPMLMK